MPPVLEKYVLTWLSSNYPLLFGVVIIVALFSWLAIRINVLISHYIEHKRETIETVALIEKRVKKCMQLISACDRITRNQVVWLLDDTKNDKPPDD